MIPKFHELGEGWNILICPKCGETYLHHDKVEIFDREEDRAWGIHVTVANNEVKVNDSLLDNPSSRRHALKIFFWCEDCGAKSVLVISQHKGNTFVYFEVVPL